MDTDATEETGGEVTYLGSISLEKEQVQKIVVNYLVSHNPDLQDISDESNSLKFRPVWLTDDSFMEVHFTRLEETAEESIDLSGEAS
tara:strand:- start:1610 stop:1870 length:261 start_codon:yes stop_codon:yes gene_type:complete